MIPRISSAGDSCISPDQKVVNKEKKNRSQQGSRIRSRTDPVKQQQQQVVKRGFNLASKSPTASRRLWIENYCRAS